MRIRSSSLMGLAACATASLLTACGSGQPLAVSHSRRVHDARVTTPTATLAASSSSVVFQWGQYGGGGLRPGIGLERAKPVLVAVNSGGSTTYAIDRAGGLWAWGNNHVAQLGDGSIARVQLTPVKDPVRVSQISSTAHNVAALAATG